MVAKLALPALTTNYLCHFPESRAGFPFTEPGLQTYNQATFLSSICAEQRRNETFEKELMTQLQAKLIATLKKIIGSLVWATQQKACFG